MSIQPETGYAPPRTSGLAIASLVLGILGIVFAFFSAIPGLILGIVALCQIKESGRLLTGRGIAIAGIVVSILTTFIVPAAILLPVFVAGREQARKATCANNLKQISTAINMYTQDYDMHFPPAERWSTVIFPYIRSESFFKCPDDESGSRSSYAFNSALGGLSVRAVDDPADTVGTFDARSQWDLAGGADLMAFRHTGGAIVGFAEGHVSFVRGNNAAFLTWSPRRSQVYQYSAGR